MAALEWEGRDPFLSDLLNVKSQRPCQTLATVRYLLFRTASRVLLGRLAGKALGGGVIRDLEEASGRPEVALRTLRKRLLAPARIVDYPFPDDYPGWFRRSEAFAARYQYELKDMSACAESGLLWIPDVAMLQQSMGSLPRLYGSRRAVVDALRPLIRGHTTSPVVVAARYSYYHWLIEVLPEVLHARAYHPDVRVLLPASPSAYVRASLEFFDQSLASTAIETSDAIGGVDVVLTPRWVNSGFVPPEDLTILREGIASRLRAVQKDGSPIYVSRRGTKNRAFSNESELEVALQARGFRVLRFETMAFADQLRACAETSLIVAPHGAGLSNIIAGSKPLHVHEIFPPNWTNDCYARLSLCLGFGYSYSMCSVERGCGTMIPIEEVLTSVDFCASEPPLRNPRGRNGCEWRAAEEGGAPRMNASCRE